MKLVKTYSEIDLDLVDFDHTNNHRFDQWGGAADVQILRDSMLIDGQLKAGVVEKVNGRYKVIQGTGRLTAVKDLKASGAICDATGKPFTTFKAFVYENLSPQDRFMLTVDQSERRLTRADLYLAIRHGLNSGIDRQYVLVQLRRTIDDIVLPKRSLKGETTAEQEKDYKKMRNGLLLMTERVMRSPIVMEKAVLERYNGQHTWPKDSEINECATVFKDECTVENDPTRQYNRANPGPKFLARWQKVLDSAAQAAADGNEGKGTNTSMANKTQTTNFENQFSNWYAKAVIGMVLREQFNDNDLPALDAIGVMLVGGRHTEAKAAFDELVLVRSGSKAKTPDAPAPEPAVA